MPLSHQWMRTRGLRAQMFGDAGMRAAGVRLLLLYQITGLGKKLLFMGGEWGMEEAWSPRRGLPWEAVAEDLQYYTACLNRFYLAEPALWQQEEAYGKGFAWIDPNNGEQSILSYRRQAEDGRELIVVLNFTPVRRDDFLLAVPQGGRYREVFNSDSVQFGGAGAVNPRECVAESCLPGDCENAIRVTVPPMGGAVFRAV